MRLPQIRIVTAMLCIVIIVLTIALITQIRINRRNAAAVASFERTSRMMRDVGERYPVPGRDPTKVKALLKLD